MDLGVFDARAGLLISHPHHQLSADPSVSQITEFVIVVWLRDEGGRGQRGGGAVPSGPVCLQAARQPTFSFIRKSDQQVCVFCMCKHVVINLCRLYIVLRPSSKKNITVLK